MYNEVRMRGVVFMVNLMATFWCYMLNIYVQIETIQYNYVLCFVINMFTIAFSYSSFVAYECYIKTHSEVYDVVWKSRFNCWSNQIRFSVSCIRVAFSGDNVINFVHTHYVVRSWSVWWIVRGCKKESFDEEIFEERYESEPSFALVIYLMCCSSTWETY